jgi:hypothetical protein
VLRFDTAITTTSVPTAAAAELIQLEDAGGSGVLHFNQRDGHLDSYHYRSDIAMTMSAPTADGQLSGRISYFTNTFLQRIEPGSPPVGAPVDPAPQ